MQMFLSLTQHNNQQVLSFFPCYLTPKEKEKHWMELGLNPGPLDFLPTSLTTIPWLLRVQLKSYAASLA